MTEITIYHNPKCSKSRQTLAHIRDAGIEPGIVEYLANPPDEKTLRKILGLLNMRPRDLMRKGEEEYKSLGLENPTLTDDQLISIMREHPRLIERPIVVKDNKAVIGRPPENVKSLL